MVVWAGEPSALRVKQPFDGAALFAFFAARTLPGVEKVEGNSYERTFAEGKRGRAGTVRLALRRRGRSVFLSLEIPSWANPVELTARSSRLFDVSADPRAIARALSRDPLLAPLVARRPGLRVPGAWDPFEVAVRAVLGQQISVAGARTLAGRLVALPGFGPWTAHVVALRAFGEGDAFPAGDLGVVRALERAGVRGARNVAARAERWRPFRAYATIHLWASLTDGKGGA
jgi:AraC family transcriptional regulator of adaptative response / DNA-3-methyladenine glycosylase II